MLYNVKQPYTPPLEIHELNAHALLIDTETVGSGMTVEIIEIALGDSLNTTQQLAHLLNIPIRRQQFMRA